MYAINNVTCGGYHIGDGFITRLSEEEWNALCDANEPVSLGEGRLIFYDAVIPLEMKRKYAKIIASERPSLQEALMAVDDANRTLRNIEALQPYL